MNKIARHLPIIISLAWFTGCATQTNPFSQFYEDTRPFRSNVEVASLRPPPGPPTIINTGGLTKDMMLALRNKGYVEIGRADFTGPRPLTNDLISEQAKKVNAELVLHCIIFDHEEQRIMPISTYKAGQNQITTTSGNATVYGSRGGAAYGNYSETATTTTPGELQTNYIPVTRRDFRHILFFYALKRPEAMTPSEREAHGS